MISIEEVNQIEWCPRIILIQTAFLLALLQYFIESSTGSRANRNNGYWLMTSESRGSNIT